MLAAFLSGKTIGYEFAGSDSDCNPNGHYDTAKSLEYLIINE